jgi:hypothetical protein
MIQTLPAGIHTPLSQISVEGSRKNQFSSNALDCANIDKPLNARPKTVGQGLCTVDMIEYGRFGRWRFRMASSVSDVSYILDESHFGKSDEIIQLHDS